MTTVSSVARDSLIRSLDDEEFVSHHAAMVSYSRRNKEFVSQLVDAIRALDLTLWVDWDCIAPAVDFMDVIRKGIEESNAFLFIISTASSTSKYCQMEVDHAVFKGKFIIPVSYEHADLSQIPAISALLPRALKYEGNFQILASQIHNLLTANVDYLNWHTKFMHRACEWHTHNKDRSYLCKGDELDRANFWTDLALERGTEPVPTRMHQMYLFSANEHLEAKILNKKELNIKLIELLEDTNGVRRYSVSSRFKHSQSLLGSAANLPSLGHGPHSLQSSRSLRSVNRQPGHSGSRRGTRKSRRPSAAYGLLSRNNKGIGRMSTRYFYVQSPQNETHCCFKRRKKTFDFIRGECWLTFMTILYVVDFTSGLVEFGLQVLYEQGIAQPTQGDVMEAPLVLRRPAFGLLHGLRINVLTLFVFQYLVRLFVHQELFFKQSLQNVADMIYMMVLLILEFVFPYSVFTWLFVLRFMRVLRCLRLVLNRLSKLVRREEYKLSECVRREAKLRSLLDVFSTDLNEQDKRHMQMWEQFIISKPGKPGKESKHQTYTHNEMKDWVKDVRHNEGVYPGLSAAMGNQDQAIANVILDTSIPTQAMINLSQAITEQEGFEKMERRASMEAERRASMEASKSQVFFSPPSSSRNSTTKSSSNYHQVNYHQEKKALRMPQALAPPLSIVQTETVPSLTILPQSQDQKDRKVRRGRMSVAEMMTAVPLIEELPYTEVAIESISSSCINSSINSITNNSTTESGT